MTAHPVGSCQPPPGGRHDRDRFDHAGEGGARHGVAAPRGLAARPGSRGGRFTRMFPFLPRTGPRTPALKALNERLRAVADVDSGHNDAIPAGYTYLGQFIDHDITFDATSKIDRDNDPHALVNFRTARFDLDSLYGSGPADQPFLYDWDCGSHRGAKLLVGHNPPDPCRADSDQPACVDLPRNAQGRAIIGDARNDENLLVSQLHLLFIKFHNRVVEHLHDQDKRLTGNALFDEAHRMVRWHYQWIVTHDFLKRIVGDDLWASLRPRVERGAHAKPAPPSYGWEHEPFMPVEFSAAAYRFGHSMVRRSYPFGDTPVRPLILPAPGHEDEPHLGGFRRLPAALEAPWPRLFLDAHPNVIKSLRIEHRLSKPLFTLPPDDVSLALLNLKRGRALGLPSGRDVSRAMGEDPLDEGELFPGSFWPREHKPDKRAALLAAPPLWFYLLREAGTRCTPPDAQGTHLGPVGGRIVAEVLIGLLEADPSSYLHHRRPWTPKLVDGDFTMGDLLHFTLSEGDSLP